MEKLKSYENWDVKVWEQIEKAITTQSKEGRRITDRPKEVESRNEVGHWEMDLVEGTKNNKGKVLLVWNLKR